MAFVATVPSGGLLADGDKKLDARTKAGQDKSDKEATTAKKGSADKEVKIRWGMRRKETPEQYDKRYATLLKRIKQDTLNDADAADVKMWTVTSGPFIVRTDISAAFTADTAMYMEMLHREYGEAYSKLLGGVPSQIKEKVEVVVFADRKTYYEKAKGMPGSGGVFMRGLFQDRDPSWPALHYRLQQFTDGITDLAKWPKATLKHEAAHMELTMRMGLLVDPPRWFNEGHACVFEYWDFDKSVEENFAEIPKRGRYAPFIRRIYGTKAWKNFDYVWNVDAATWAQDMTSSQGFLNYAQAWSLAAYMMHEGTKGRADFRKIFNLSARVRSPSDTGRSRFGRGGSLAWEDAFPAEDRAKLAKNWGEWVEKNLPKDKSNPDEVEHLAMRGVNPEVTNGIAPLEPDEAAKMRRKLEKKRKTEKDRIEK